MTKRAKPTPTWISVLNEQSTWTDWNAFYKWFGEFLGRSPRHLDASVVDRFWQTLRYMRLEFAKLHFGEPLDLHWLNEQLAGTTFALGLRADEPSLTPALHAVTCTGAGGQGDWAECGEPRTGDSATLEALRKTLLLQFAVFIGESIDSGDRGERVLRCNGLYRDVPGHVPEDVEYPEQFEERWRAEVEALARHGVTADGITRCTDFYEYSPKARFCSDKCRFSTFQILKQLDDPNYLADKQKRYRQKKK